jgi:hypothetical protein
VRALFLSGVALIAAGGVLLRIALRMRDPQRYRWAIPRPSTPPGLDPLPDVEPFFLWEDPETVAAEIARIEQAARHSKVLPSRFSRVVPPEPPATASPTPTNEDAQLVLPNVADSDHRTDGAEEAPSAADGATRSRASPAVPPKMARRGDTGLEGALHVLREDLKRFSE